MINLNLNDIIKEARQLPLVPLTATSKYQDKISVLTEFVNETLETDPSIHALIGNNPRQIMYDNHRHHAAFMASVFMVCNYELLSRTIPWVYRTYSARRFSYDYFLLELKAWIVALDKFLDPHETKEIKTVYNWMISRHENMIHLSHSEESLTLPISENWLGIKNTLQTALLEGNTRKCYDIVNESLKTEKDVEKFYLQIIQPVMYEIGMLWESGIVSVAQEHLASAIVSRIMATTSMIKTKSPQTRGKAVVTAAPNEFHEIGAWMISDLLEYEGWEVRYLGANTPKEDLLKLLKSFQPHLLALSVSMPFNIIKAKEIISSVKENNELNKILIMVGGRPFNETVDLWRSIGADAFAANALEAKNLANKWYGHEKH
jgi:MerR family transcriptional regulator, light-induced transcriptional regulator